MATNPLPRNLWQGEGEPARLEAWDRDLAAIRRELGQQDWRTRRGAGGIESVDEADDDLLEGGEEESLDAGAGKLAIGPPSRQQEDEEEEPGQPPSQPGQDQNASRTPHARENQRRLSEGTVASKSRTKHCECRPSQTSSEERQKDISRRDHREQTQQQPAGIDAIDVDAAMDAAGVQSQTATAATPLPRRQAFYRDRAGHFPSIPQSPEIRAGYAPRAPAGATLRDFTNYDPQTARFSLTHEELQAMLMEAAQSAAASKMAELSQNASGTSRGVSMASIVKMPGTPTAKQTRAPKLDTHIQLDPSELIIPMHIVKTLGEGWNKSFPLSDLKPENCYVMDKARTNREHTRIVFDEGQLYTMEPERNMAADNTMNTTDFITAGQRFAKAALKYYEPKRDVPTLSAQLTEHFERIATCPDFQQNFHRYRRYSAELFERWIADPTWCIGDWQSAIFQQICEDDRDRCIDKGCGTYFNKGGKQSFRDDAVGGKQPFRDETAAGSRAGSQQKPRENSERRGQKWDSNGKNRCIYCGAREGHTSWHCAERTGSWCIRSPGSNKWQPPIADLQVCWNWNHTKGCDNTECKFTHACTLCGSGASPNTVAAHNAQRCDIVA
ncbi:hypothetical protein B0H13DRAFT_1914473 [Mycena leptocephala]|nr:hypothetical protein B0H13DRAFT_1914473 [Mycena leptocephala]